VSTLPDRRGLPTVRAALAHSRALAAFGASSGPLVIRRIIRGES
jgi:hypothetical protein